MGESLSLFVGENSQPLEPRFRLADFLRGRYQRERFATQTMSKEIGCSPKTAENMLDGHWPNSRHFQRIVQIFGQDVLDAVFGPDINATVARLRREEAALEQLLAEKRARRIAVEGAGSGDPERASEAARPVEDRSFRPRVVR